MPGFGYDGVMLVVFSGLPGVGKSTVAREVCRQSGATYFRVDSVEAALREDGMTDEEIGGKGYMAGYAVATDNLAIGRVFVVDLVNPWAMTRDAWRRVGEEAGVEVLEIEVVCSDKAEHRRRVESRNPERAGWKVPTWEEVLGRDYQAWDREVLRVDTVVLSVEEAVRVVLRAMGRG